LIFATFFSRETLPAILSTFKLKFMYKKLHFVFVIFVIGYINCFSQTSDIRSIRFHYSNSTVIPSEVEIQIYQSDKAAIVEIKSPNRNTKTAITTQKYSELCDALLKIDPKDVLQNIKLCLDGGTSILSFRNSSNHIEYAVNCLTEKDESTVYKDFLYSVKLILEVAKLKLSNIE
jgi:hypothetical protein